MSYPAGGSVEVAARLLQTPLTQALGQQVVVENKGGTGSPSHIAGELFKLKTSNRP